jgi:hypothetical protein
MSTFTVDDFNIQPDGLSTVSPSMACTWNTDNLTDPNWDECFCNTVNYTMTCKGAVEWECCPDTSPYPPWSEFTANLQDIQIHPDTGTISPWYCERFYDWLMLKLASLTSHDLTDCCPANASPTIMINQLDDYTSESDANEDLSIDDACV